MPPEDDEYAQLFASAAENGATLPAEGTPPAGTPPVETPPAETPPVETPPAETPPAGTPPVETPPAETPPAGTPAADPAETPPAPSADDIVTRLAEALKNQPPVAPAAETPPAEPPAEQPLFTPQETEAIENYRKNWPDVMQAEQLVRRAEYHDLLKFVFGQVVQYVGPLQDQLRTLGNHLHFTELKSAVPDYSDSLEDQVSSWIDTQPAYLQGPFKQVMQTGTSDEVADLIRRYRESSGAAPAAPAAAPAAATPPAAPAKTELSNAAKQAAVALAPVGTERTSVPQGEDPQDFNAAFAKYAEAGVT